MGNRVTIGTPGPWGNNSFEVGNDFPLMLIAGPCQIETLDHALKTAERLMVMCANIGMAFIYKSSYDKANRSSLGTPRGPGIVEGLRILEEVRRQIGVPVTTDVHDVAEAYTASMVVDLVQVPALLSRQTDLLAAAGEHGRAVSIKKGQGLHPAQMGKAVKKVANPNTILIERGTSFGYGLVNDFAAWPDMRRYAPVVFDATHSVQRPATEGKVSGGARQLVPDLAAAAVAVGIAGVFIECHEAPDYAPSDGPCMVDMVAMPLILNRLQRIDAATKSYTA